MTNRIFLFIVSMLTVAAVYAQDEAPAAPPVEKFVRPKNKSISTTIVLTGLIQNINIGLESSNFYNITSSTITLPVFQLRYIHSRKHQFGIKGGMNFNNNSSTKTDSVQFRSTVSPSKTNHAIQVVNPSFPGFMTDEVSSNTKSFIFIPFYEYHFTGTRRWDYYIGVEYMIKFQLTPKSKNYETLKITNSNNDVMDYSYRYTKGALINNQSIIGTIGLNYFIYRWLSVGTKISYALQSFTPVANNYDEKLLVNGVDQTFMLLNSNTSKTVVNRNSNSAFLNGGYGGFLINFYL